MIEHTNDYLLDKKVKIFQPVNGYRASSDAVLLSSLPHNLKPTDNILDVGSGTGGIALCLSHRFPQNSVTGLEIQPDLCELANFSAEQNGFAQTQFFNCDIKNKNLPVANCSFAHVISNPPYSEHDMPSPNHSKALAHNHSGLDLNSWINFCLKMLKPFGHLYIIHRAEALPQILTSLSGKAGKIQIIPVYSKPKQNAKRVMIIAQKDAKTPASVLPPLYIYDATDDYTSAARQILREGKSFFAIDI